MKRKKKLIVTSYINNELRKLRYYMPNDLYIIIFKYYNSKNLIFFDKDCGRYKFRIALIGDPGTGKSNILLRYAVCIINSLN